MSATADATPTPTPRSDASPEALPGGRCPNCLAPLQGPFCHDCGQSKKGLIRHFSSIVGDFVDSVLNFDTRTWRTVPALYFRPGYLSNEYFAGRRVRYVTPLRLYVFLSVVAFLVISFVTPDITPEHGQAVGISEKEGAATAEQGKAERIAKAVDEAQEEDEDLHLTFGNEEWDEKKNPLTFAWLTDGMNAALNAEIAEVVRKARGINKNPGPFVKQLYSTAPQALFVILPLFALLLKVFFIFKRRLYMEHLIVALHSHSFLCLSLLVGVGLAQLEEAATGVPFVNGVLNLLFALCWAWIPLYLFLMQKRVYRQGWIMTSLKFLAIGICYLFLLVFGMLATIVVSLIVL